MRHLQVRVPREASQALHVLHACSRAVRPKVRPEPLVRPARPALLGDEQGVISGRHTTSMLAFGYPLVLGISLHRGIYLRRAPERRDIEIFHVVFTVLQGLAPALTATIDDVTLRVTLTSASGADRGVGHDAPALEQAVGDFQDMGILKRGSCEPPERKRKAASTTGGGVAPKKARVVGRDVLVGNLNTLCKVLTIDPQEFLAGPVDPAQIKDMLMEQGTR
jgi:hypothetical protein